MKESQTKEWNEKEGRGERRWNEMCAKKFEVNVLDWKLNPTNRRQPASFATFAHNSSTITSDFDPWIQWEEELNQRGVRKEGEERYMLCNSVVSYKSGHFLPRSRHSFFLPSLIPYFILNNNSIIIEATGILLLTRFLPSIHPFPSILSFIPQNLTWLNQKVVLPSYCLTLLFNRIIHPVLLVVHRFQSVAGWGSKSRSVRLSKFTKPFPFLRHLFNHFSRRTFPSSGRVNSTVSLI